MDELISILQGLDDWFGTAFYGFDEAELNLIIQRLNRVKQLMDENDIDVTPEEDDV